MTAKEFSEVIAKEMNDAKRFIARRTAKKMRNKLIKVYDYCINEFYKYENKVYQRHNIDLNEQGTGIGQNLYLANDSTGEPSRLLIDNHTVNGGLNFQPDDMSPYKYNSQAEVLDYILHGIRYPKYTKNYKHAGSKFFPEMSFVVSYSDEKVSMTGTPLEILEAVRDAYVDLYTEQAKKEAEKELNLKYIKIT